MADADKYFELRRTLVNNEVLAVPADVPRVVALWKGGRRVPDEQVPRLTFQTSWKKFGGDLVDCMAVGGGAGRYLGHLASPKLVTLLSGAGFSGWQAIPVDVHVKGRPTVTDYSFLHVYGRCGMALDDRKRIETYTRYEGDKGWLEPRGYYFDPATWDGSDVFSPFPKMFLFVTQSVARLLKRSKLYRVELEPLSEFWFPRPLPGEPLYDEIAARQNSEARDGPD